MAGTSIRPGHDGKSERSPDERSDIQGWMRSFPDVASLIRATYSDYFFCA